MDITVEKGEAILQVSGLTKIYGWGISLGGKTFGRRVIGAHDVSFSVRKGEIFGFLGPNGAGKTTTIRAILDYLNIQKGTITVFGLDHHRNSIKIKESMGYLPGDLTLYEDFTGDELIDYFGHFRPVDPDFLKELKSMFRVDLTLKVKSLSSGNRQQIGLILALASKPDLLILDEPTLGLDPLMATNVHNLLKKLKAEGKTVFLSSHDLAEVQAICDRIGIIKEGRMILVETIENLVNKFLQNVRIRFHPSKVPSEKELAQFESVISVERTNETTFTLKIKEDVNELLRWLSNYHIERISILDVTLDEIFLQYYK